MAKSHLFNSPETFRRLASDLDKFGVKPEIEIYHEGVIQEAKFLQAEDVISGKLLFAFALGIRSGTSASCKNLLNLAESIPSGSSWSALAIGKAQLPINIHTILLGDHVRTGLEDNVYYPRNKLAKDNAQLVERIISLAEIIGREVASPSEARRIISL